ncbi:hypothetical protein P9869_22215 [Streptomyces ossamyceticus]|nr:hypothetical protein [Streptomyces ossamyceticus]
MPAIRICNRARPGTAALASDRVLVRTAASHAGSNCLDDCAFELCPYPSSRSRSGHGPKPVGSGVRTRPGKGVPGRPSPPP